MRRRVRARVLAVALAAAGCESSRTTLEDVLARVAWFSTMREQPAVQAYEEAPRPPAEGTLPIDGAFAPTLAEAEAIRASRVPPTPESLARGRQAYDVFCALCHGPEGRGGGSVVGPTGWPPGLIPDLTAERARGLTDGYLYGMIVNGRGLMPSYRRIPERERWDIVNYVRELQRTAPVAGPAGGAR